MLSPIRWLGQQLLDLLPAQDPARLCLEVKGQCVGVCTGMTASEGFQLPA
jgi:hypothetical protein